MPQYPSDMTYPTSGKTIASTNTEPQWEPVHLKPQHVEMIKQHVQGIPITRIAYNFKRFGVAYSHRQIDRVLKSAKGQEFASFYSAQLNGGTVGLTFHGAMYAPEAMYTEIDIMRNPLAGERHRLNASQDLMDRVGPPKISRQETENRQPTTIIVNLTASQLSQFQNAPAMVEAEVVPLLDTPSSANDD